MNPDEMAVIAVGGNLSGDYPSSEALLEAAIDHFGQAELPVVRRSGWWRSAAWPDSGAPEYLNAVILVETKLEPQSMLARLLALEAAFGRRRGVQNAPRTLDLDIVLFDDRVVNTAELVVPHPGLADRAFWQRELAALRHSLMGHLDE